MQRSNRYHLLENAPTQAFQRSTRLILRLLDVTGVAIFLTGLDGDWRLVFLSGCPRSQAADIEPWLSALPDDEPWVLSDSSNAPLSAERASTPPPFLASAPLTCPEDGANLGYLVVTGTNSSLGEQSRQTRQNLRDCADMIVEQLELRLQVRQADMDVRQLEQYTTQLTESERRFETLVNLLPLFIVVKDYDGHMLLSNKAHAESYGSTPEEMVGRHFFEFLTPREIAEAVLEADRRVIDTGETLRAIREVDNNGSQFIFDVMKIKYDNWEPGVDAVLGVVTDVTELKERERELADQSRELEHLVEELSRSNRQLEQFAYVASHDLQEPLRMVTSFLTLLDEEYGGQLDADADEYIGYAVDGARRMKAMINDLLEYSRVRRSDEPFTDVDLDALVETVGADLQAAHPDVAVSLTHDLLAEVRGRRGQLERLFTNLFSNAVKYAGSGSPHIHVSCTRLDDEWRIAVEDNGIGIPPDQHERIFDVFVRGRTTRQTPGTGIGLAICATIVEEHDGRIWVESDSAHGSTFYFTLSRNHAGAP
ncbi:PAS domain S-box protein [Persicimonas caeni]|uniref:histidine kinase n=1 Tax=Persicimonas caeni TaxID=2292766 RepID=A0A4Y6PRG5_PERCE|nr:ATP-binding protein [Persicimonas caeni]QDG50932.1 PAS domain S-box protein [Persicimonas caeni]QED32153.1 PAS domain S-box protein [Persicimonas caeni]